MLLRVVAVIRRSSTAKLNSTRTHAPPCATNNRPQSGKRTPAGRESVRGRLLAKPRMTRVCRGPRLSVS